MYGDVVGLGMYGCVALKKIVEMTVMGFEVRGGYDAVVLEMLSRHLDSIVVRIRRTCRKGVEGSTRPRVCERTKTRHHLPCTYL